MGSLLAINTQYGVEHLKGQDDQRLLTAHFIYFGIHLPDPALPTGQPPACPSALSRVRQDPIPLIEFSNNNSNIVSGHRPVT